jgi:hypothetical protein
MEITQIFDLKIGLIQLWFGPIPDYFKYHLETIKNIDFIDFHFFTDQELDIEQSNFYYYKIDREYVTQLLSKKLNCKIEINSDKKFCDVKAALSDIFYLYIKDYDYVGCYDIDTLFGDVNKFLKPHLGFYDFISIGEKTFYNRLSGPFLIYKNSEELRTLYKKNEFIRCMSESDVKFFEENELNKLVSEKYTKYIISDINVDPSNAKLLYETNWNGGQLYCGNREIFIHHFYRKNNTILGKIGNTVFSKFKKALLDDFMWVVHFSKSYEKYVPQLLKSIHNYSNRKCIVYTINYDSELKYEYQYISDQFIFIRLDIESGKPDTKGRDSAIMNSKPFILSNALDRFPNKKFVHIDTDISLTTNSDKICQYFDQLEDYPLINSHIHDVIYFYGFAEDGGLTSSLHILLEAIGVDTNVPLPRRKCNIIVFDENSRWFFSEQMELYHRFKNSDDPAVLTLHDEDTANAVLTKYQLFKCLPLIDIEETFDLSMDVLYKYSYSLTPISEHVSLPKNLNEILFFHGFKSEEDFENINQHYGKKTLSHDDIDIYYRDETLFIERNNYMIDKKFEQKVDLIIYKENYTEIFNFCCQDIFNNNLFFISQFYLQPSTYLLEIVETNSRKVIYHNHFQI